MSYKKPTILAVILATLTTAAVAAPPSNGAAPTSQTAAEAEIQRGCLNALQEEKRTWLGKPMAFDVSVRRPADGDMTARCRLTVRAGSAEGQVLMDYTVLIRVHDLYALGVSSSHRPWPHAAPVRAAAANSQ